MTVQQQEQYPNISMTCLPEMGIQPELLQLVREREIETQLGEVQMNCEMCKFRLSALTNGSSHGHDHAHNHHHHHNHSHDHDHPTADPYADLTQYHERIWQAP